ncbi:MFS transporter [Streptomyces triticirhizae]|uniref:MFS transporter n=1 Tax=Streptomyces triticirhizae TaxID=2483353 RepID=UPI001315357A|nr:MFS transporter [Streptomyces triticirhizae]
MTTDAAPAEAAAPAPRPLRANRDFRLLWVGQALSDFGASMTFVVLPLALLGGGHSPQAASTIGTAVLVTAMLARLPGGYLADRFRHRTLMLVADVARCVMFAVVAVWTFLGDLPLWLAVASVMVAQLGVELFKPSQSAVVRRVVPAGQLPTAMSLNQARGYAAEIAAPAAAGLLVAVELGLPFAVEAATFAASAVCVWFLSPAARASRAAEPQPSPVKAKAQRPDEGERFWRRMTAGLRYVAANRFLRTLAVLATGLNFLFQALVYALILGLGQREGGSGAVGAALSAAAVTGLLGSLVAPFLQRRLRIQLLVAAGPALAAALLAVAWAGGSELAFAGSLAAMSLLTPVIAASLAVLLATMVPREIYGRTTSAIGFVTELFQPLGPLAAGLLLAGLPLTGVAALFAAGFGVLAVLALFLPAPTPTPPDPAPTSTPTD